jgi:hypothetical protein
MRAIMEELQKEPTFDEVQEEFAILLRLEEEF